MCVPGYIHGAECIYVHCAGAVIVRTVSAGITDILMDVMMSVGLMDASALGISDYIFQNNDEIREGMDDVMGGKVLELTSDKIKAIRSESKDEAQNALVNAIQRIRAGETVDELIASGVDEQTANLAYTCR